MPENEKALRYIAQLDDARCNARWDTVPELARKIEKHAPHRTCLYLTARAEAETAAYIRQRPTTPEAPSPPQAPDLTKLVSPLTEAYDRETTHREDAFAAQVALAYIHFTLGEHGMAVARFPTDFSETATNLKGDDGQLSSWTQTCIVKGAYLKGYSQEKAGSTAEATKTYESVLTYLTSIPSLVNTSVQFRSWGETLLARLCIFSDLSAPTGADVDPEIALRTFQLWLRLLDNGKAPQFSNELQDGQAGIRRTVWKAHYNTLTIILQRGLLYAGSPDLPTALLGAGAEHATEEQYLTARLQQRSELKIVESVYEALLLRETRFPKASENNEEMDGWAEAVMSNWRILCGPSWTDEELGEGGKSAVGRGVLDILYRAATKSYHSTRILRHLFVVHASLAEFELAFKAFDSYVEIVSRVKDRVEKSGEEDAGLDDDDMVLRTAAEAIRILCRFGSHEESEKAKEVGELIEKWLKQQTPASRPGTATAEGEHEKKTESVVSPRALAIAYRAIGISRSQWARMTYEATARSTLQAQAAQALRTALSPEYKDSNNLETLYALGLLLAEMRDVSGAIKVVKRALASHSQPDNLRSAGGVASEGDTDDDEANYVRERKLIPLWHLLALLLTAKSDFSTAVRTCEAAFDQFDDPEILFGKSQHAEYRSEHLNESSTSIEKPRGSTKKALVDRMAPFEKEGILQVKITDLVLLETTDGTTAAVDASMELLSLYKRLFGDPTGGHKKMQLPSATDGVPQSPAGTVKGTVFRRRKSTLTRSMSMPPGTASSRASTAATEGPGAPAIHVTDTNNKPNGHHHLFHHKHDSTHRRSSLTLRKKKTNDSNVTDKPGSPEKAATEPVVDGHGSDKSSSPEQPLRTIAHNIPHDSQPQPAGHENQPPRQDVRLPAPFPRFHYSTPEPRFPVLQERKLKISLLVDVWLFIAGLYTRASLFEDARGAVEEAYKLTDILESEVAQESSSARAFSERGWGGGKSVEELWADIYATRGQISQAEGQPHEALTHFEKSLSHNPDHPAAIVGLANILLDIYSQVIPAEPLGSLKVPNTRPSPNKRASTATTSAYSAGHAKMVGPEELNRLAARDRAYSLLSSLTKLGTGWDCSEAWYALARAYEEGGQIDRAKGVLWWCVELEDTKALRKWSSVGVGGFVL
ncbi:uncharacterized protein K452DRAFT_248537 [Aplosporella prunicola CBS 121167]|uniref:Filamentation protein n=1 Tax=Aplosporella prunicola CBS 121167 TaxID=1176127 RepID=A0A6A6BK43_9PEZI|nr:uncharacterized protein K452DRAFT_248537 [Aplosporella prunicola CBS 121167]KAF2142921.1 hypothetical protein K452DRAFT_248537 [Aplosporella prunicola CBS 121167]